MATKKKTTESTPKTYTLTEEQMKQLRDFATDLMDIRRTLYNLEDEENISKIMFQVGIAYKVADEAETQFDEFLEQFEEECDECGDDF